MAGDPAHNSRSQPCDIGSKKFVFYNSRGWNALSACLFFAMLSAFVAGLIFGFRSNHIKFDSAHFGTLLILGTAIPLLAAATLAFARRVNDREPLIIIDEHGIFSREWRYGLVPWSDISAARIDSAFRPLFCNIYYLRLTLVAPEKWLQYLPYLGRTIKRVTGSKIAVAQFLNTTPSIYNAHAYILEHIAGTLLAGWPVKSSASDSQA